MAKKLTARQKQARKQAAYRKAEYNKNVDAIKYLERLGVTVPQKALQPRERITKTTLKYIRKIYKEARSNIKKYNEDYVNTQTGEVLPITNLPTKEKMVKYYRHPEETASSQPNIDFDEQYLDELTQKIRDIGHIEETIGYNKKTEKTFNKSTKPKFDEAKEAWASMIEQAIRQYGAQKVAEALSDSPHIQKIDELSMKYAYEITEEINDNILPWFESSISDALAEL